MGAKNEEDKIEITLVPLTQFENKAELNVTDVRRERIALLLSTIRERALAKGFCFSMEDTKYPCVSRRAKLPGRDVHSEKVREISRE